MQVAQLKRREFIALGAGAAAWPFAARAQQRERVRRIGVLLPAVADDPVWQARVGAFLQALALLGWTIGRNVHIDAGGAGADRGGSFESPAHPVKTLTSNCQAPGAHSTNEPLPDSCTAANKHLHSITRQRARPAIAAAPARRGVFLFQPHKPRSV
jgi:hypothetical protein